MKTATLITGGTGELGIHLLSQLIAETDRIFLLARNENSAKLTHTIETLKKWQIPVATIKTINGDITLPNCGIAPKELDTITNQVTHVIHAAADTRFSARLIDARNTNVTGTKNVLELAKKCSQLEKFAHLSTVYVSGTQEGTVLEKPLLQENFVNNYEQSKYEAEKIVYDSFEDLPVAVYRFSTVFGDGNTGYIHRVNAVHQSIKLYYYGLLSLIPGEKSSNTQLISTSYAATVFLQLFWHHFKSGQTYHIVGNDKSPTLDAFLTACEKSFRTHSANWHSKQIEVPPVVNQQAYKYFKQTVQDSGDVIMTSVINNLDLFIPHLRMKTIYDDTQTRKALKTLPKTNFDLEFDRVIAYCINSLWKKTSY